jgi:hypothetical protein
MVDFMGSQDFERSLCFSLYLQNRSSLLLQVSKFQICFHLVAYVHGYFLHCSLLGARSGMEGVGRAFTYTTRLARTFRLVPLV